MERNSQKGDILLFVKAPVANWCGNYLQRVSVFTKVILSATKSPSSDVFLVFLCSAFMFRERKSCLEGKVWKDKDFYVPCLWLMKILRETVEVPRGKYAWGAVTSNLPKTEDKQTGRILFLILKKVWCYKRKLRIGIAHYLGISFPLREHHYKIPSFNWEFLHTQAIFTNVILLNIYYSSLRKIILNPFCSLEEK